MRSKIKKIPTLLIAFMMLSSVMSIFVGSETVYATACKDQYKKWYEDKNEANKDRLESCINNDGWASGCLNKDNWANHREDMTDPQKNFQRAQCRKDYRQGYFNSSCDQGSDKRNTVCNQGKKDRVKYQEEYDTKDESKPIGNCGDVKTYFKFDCGSVDTKKGGNQNPIIAFALIAVGWITGLVSLAVVGAIVYGGFLYLSAQDNSSQTQKGIEVIVNAVIGLLLLISFYAIINFVVPGGLFN